MLSMVAVAALVGAAVATPHPECEPCAEVKGEHLEALANSGKVGGFVLSGRAGVCASRASSASSALI